MPSPRELPRKVYEELRRLAASKMAAERAGHSLDATALVHEAWLRLADASVEWRDRNHFLRVAATATRRILVGQARARRASKRGETRGASRGSTWPRRCRTGKWRR